MTKSTGIIMSGDHPTKCLDGTKTVTRRTWGLEAINLHPDAWHPVWNEGNLWAFSNEAEKTALTLSCPYGQVGDKLWVRETWAIIKENDLVSIDDMSQNSGLFYKADNSDSPMRGKWRPSIFMPRWASRADLEILPGLRPERLQAITEEDALAEGITVMQGTWQALGRGEGGKLEPVGEPHPFTARYHFGALWDNLNAHRGYPWDGNHWIWRIPFKLQG